MNSATLMPAGLPSGGIAQGSVFTINGLRLGPADTPDLSDPLTTTLSDVSISVTQGTTSVDAIPLTLSATTLTAIMPSTAALGMNSVRVTYKTGKSNPMPVNVVATQFGISTVNAAGNGPAIAQNDNGDGTTTQNTLQTPAYPGQTVYLTGTGLGAIGTDTALTPDPSNLTVQTEVFVAGESAAVTSNGRVAPGMDLIGFVLPSDVLIGCWTPVYVRTAGTNVSNFATIAISADGTPCQEPNNYLASALINGGNNGTYAVARINVRHDAGVRTPRDATTDLFGAYEASEVAGPSNFNPIFSLPPAGSCTVYTAVGDLISNPTAIIAGFTPPTGVALDDGGGASLTGDKGTKTATASVYPGISGVQLGSAVTSLPLTQQPFLASGGLTLSVPGGNDIAAVSMDGPVPQPFTWSNRNDILAITRANGLDLTWTGGDPAASVFIIVMSTDLPSNSSAAAGCIVPPGASEFIVPADVLANLPATRYRAMQSRGAVYIGQWNLAAPPNVSTPGIDFGAFLPIFVTGKSVSFQ
ncbi:MAG TPA: hypothetical protein VGL53_03645 [Bryobacteraceae bacterium]